MAEHRPWALGEQTDTQRHTHGSCLGPCAQACPPLVLGQEVPPAPLRQSGQPAWGRLGCSTDPGAGWPTGQMLLLLLSSLQGHPSLPQREEPSRLSLSVPFFAFLLPAPEKSCHFALLCWQEMDSSTEEDLEERGSAVTDGGMSQLPQAGLEETVECSQCPSA